MIFPTQVNRYFEGCQRLHHLELDFAPLSFRGTEVGLAQGFPGKEKRSYLLSFPILRFGNAPGGKKKITGEKRKKKKRKKKKRRKKTRAFQ